MRQFDVVRAAEGDAEIYPYLLIVQSDLIVEFDSRVAAPFVAPHRFRAIRYLNPIFEFDGARWMLATQMMAAVPVSELRGEIVLNLARERDTVVRALDFLLAGV